jgi:hypothetical protein
LSVALGMIEPLGDSKVPGQSCLRVAGWHPLR